MRYLKSFQIFESKSEDEIQKFKKDYGTELDPNFTQSQIKIIRSAFSHFDKKFIKNKIKKIILKDLGGVHGRWTDTKRKKEMTINPSIFNFVKRFKLTDTKEVDYTDFILVHEIGHCFDHWSKISFSKKWQSISGWKKCPIDEKIPEGHERYIEKRKGREIAGHKKSDWVYKEGSEFCRRYSSRNPREDFADSFAFAVFGGTNKFKGEGGKKKFEIVQELLSEIS
jgi:hypothetical protein